MSDQMLQAVFDVGQVSYPLETRQAKRGTRFQGQHVTKPPAQILNDVLLQSGEIGGSSTLPGFQDGRQQTRHRQNARLLFVFLADLFSQTLANLLPQADFQGFVRFRYGQGYILQVMHLAKRMRRLGKHFRMN